MGLVQRYRCELTYLLLLAVKRNNHPARNRRSSDRWRDETKNSRLKEGIYRRIRCSSWKTKESPVEECEFSVTPFTQLRPWMRTQDSRGMLAYRKPASTNPPFVSRSCSSRFCRSSRWKWLVRWLLLSVASLWRIATPESRIERSSALCETCKAIQRYAHKGLTCVQSCFVDEIKLLTYVAWNSVGWTKRRECKRVGARA